LGDLTEGEFIRRQQAQEERLRAAYAGLYGVIGTWHGQGDGSTTFNVPDYRGRFLRGVDGSAGNDPDVSSRVAMATGGNTGNKVGTVQADQLAAHQHTFPITNNTAGAQNTSAAGNKAPPGDGNLGTGTSGGSETRPKNASVNYVIKT